MRRAEAEREEKVGLVYSAVVTEETTARVAGEAPEAAAAEAEGCPAGEGVQRDRTRAFPQFP